MYRAKAMKQLISVESKRGPLVGAVRALEKIIKDINEGPRNIEKT